MVFLPVWSNFLNCWIKASTKLKIGPGGPQNSTYEMCSLFISGITDKRCNKKAIHMLEKLDLTADHKFMTSVFVSVLPFPGMAFYSVLSVCYTQYCVSLLKYECHSMTITIIMMIIIITIVIIIIIIIFIMFHVNSSHFMLLSPWNEAGVNN